MLEEGTKAPDFLLKDAKGKTHKLSDYKGKKVILYFYPKDDTPGCTIEANDFKMNHRQFLNKNAVVLGVSPDSEASHQKFIEKYSLPFTLLADPKKKVIQQYGAWGERNLYGRKFMGIKRSTYVINEKGNITKIYANVRAKGHVEKVLASL
mgnify:CR=1 FL=1